MSVVLSRPVIVSMFFVFFFVFVFFRGGGGSKSHVDGTRETRTLTAQSCRRKGGEKE